MTAIRKSREQQRSGQAKGFASPEHSLQGIKALPKVSICTVTYNRAHFLPLLQEHIFNQDYPRDLLEWVIVDDSDDGRPGFKPNYGRGLEIRYERLAAKLTLGRKRNLSHEFCSGEVIVYMDDDDCYPPERVSHAIECLLASDALIAGCSVLPILFLPERDLWVAGPYGKNHATAGTFAFKRKLIYNAFYDETKVLAEEKSFLKNFQLPMVQLDPARTILCIAHDKNTFEKRALMSSGGKLFRPSSKEEKIQFLRSFDARLLHGYQEAILGQSGQKVSSVFTSEERESVSSASISGGVAYKPRIPKTIHLIWIGDDSKCPDRCIESWRRMNPGFRFRLWGNQDLRRHQWILATQMQKWLGREICGVADLMRWEILYKYGGVAFDADSICIRPLEEWLLEPEVFAVWENEVVRPGLIATGALGACPKNRLILQIIKDILADPDITSDRAWRKVGPLRLTHSWRRISYPNLTIYPSHYFIPSHFAGSAYSGGGPVFAKQAWGSTRQSYGNLVFE